MAKKKKSEELQETVLEPVEVVEASPEVEEVKPKSSKKKKAVEEVAPDVVEEVTAVPAEPELSADKVKEYFENLDAEASEPPIVFEGVNLAEEKPKKVKKPAEKKEKKPAIEAKKAKPANEVPYNAIVNAKVALNVMKEPSVFCTKVGSLKAGSRVKILEVCGNFGKIGNGKWININYIEKI